MGIRVLHIFPPSSQTAPRVPVQGGLFSCTWTIRALRTAAAATAVVAAASSSSAPPAAAAVTPLASLFLVTAAVVTACGESETYHGGSEKYKRGWRFEIQREGALKFSEFLTPM